MEPGVGARAEIAALIADELQGKAGVTVAQRPRRRIEHIPPLAASRRASGEPPCRGASCSRARCQRRLGAWYSWSPYVAIRESNPFPSVCSRVCDHKCERHCRLAVSGEDPVAIRTLKRFVTPPAAIGSHDASTATGCTVSTAA
ncbi:MAG: hypothetical protein IT373_01980 [Polyangiaceae bacterium]|nr:hypothetical protein [Polyangiaceae bacterium]